MNREEKNNLVPVWERATITLEEAAANPHDIIAGRLICHFSQLSDTNAGIGSRRMIKRRKLDEYLENAYSV